METNCKFLKNLFSHHPGLIHISDKAGDTPLHYVLKAEEIYLEYIDILLAHGADPLQPDSDSNTALHFFAQKPLTYKSRIEQFQDLSANINARNKMGNSPLFGYIAHGWLRAGGPSRIFATMDTRIMIMFTFYDIFSKLELISLHIIMQARRWFMFWPAES